MNPVPAERPRLLPDVPLPAYTHVPGRTPHPVSDPRGHSFGRRPEPPRSFDAGQWPSCRDYLHGIDLFNNGYYWESHEAWEGLWHAAGHRGTTADFLKALIKLAAAGVKHGEGKPAGVKSHAERAAGLFRETARTLGAGADVFLGLRIGALIELAEQVGRDGWPEQSPLLLPTFPLESV